MKCVRTSLGKIQLFIAQNIFRLYNMYRGISPELVHQLAGYTGKTQCSVICSTVLICFIFVNYCNWSFFPWWWWFSLFQRFIKNTLQWFWNCWRCFFQCFWWILSGPVDLLGLRTCNPFRRSFLFPKDPSPVRLFKRYALEKKSVFSSINNPVFFVSTLFYCWCNSKNDYDLLSPVQYSTQKVLKIWNI